jgi:hypothetical protein
MNENKSLAIIYGSVIGKIQGNNQNFLAIYHTLCSTYIASYLGLVFLIETSVLLPANDVEAFACAIIYCKCMLVIPKPFVLVQIDVHKEYYLLGCNILYSGRISSTFRRNTLYRPSGSKVCQASRKKKQAATRALPAACCITSQAIVYSSS